jgi:NitT/TauT family transport system substrate-binding protein
MRRLIQCLIVALAIGASQAAVADPVKIRASWTVPVSNWMSILLEKKDLMTHLGKSYVLEPTRYTGTPLMVTALANGELDVANLTFSAIGLAVQNAGLDDLRIIADEFQDGVGDNYSQEFFVLKDAPVQKVQDLKGKILATNALGSAVDIAMKAMLRKNGMEDRRDYTVVEAQFPAMRALLAEKKAALVPGVLPFSLDPELRKISRTLFVQKEAVGTTQMAIYAARKGFIDKNRPALVDFMEDTLRVVRWYLDPANHNEAVAIAVRVTKQPAAIFEFWLFTNKDYFRDPNMLPNLIALQANVDEQKALGFLKGDIDIKGHSDLSVISEAAQRMK